MLVIYYSFLVFQKCLFENCDAEENSRPKSSSSQSFSICHWNLNSISVHNYIKWSFLRAYVSTHKIDVILTSEINLDFDSSTVDEKLKIVGYTLIRADHPANITRGGVSINYKLSLAFRLLDIYYLE